MKDDLGWLLVIILGGLFLLLLSPLAVVRHLTKEKRHKPTEREWLAIIRE